MGANEESGDIPFYPKHSPAVWTLEKNSEGIPYNDNRCALRALAAFQLKRRVNPAERTYELFAQETSRKQIILKELDINILKNWRHI